ncbi:Deoxyadenosine/deoxycytidine kinase [Mariprofundus ferrinatatus]|uniref:Deoxyadenosine/deoxycytidine kinase n=1 Tax=Mariprofundus ferrinatatus TaxID=1921087 RepID=A0A2K8L2H0_9PROT|nr:deoxynucleoside kinase [Mariprofundus ferrinatatus]ATX81487.1 Deoxyadenosine/deoxycytidine kinase [Mariprofundus ferrinatatus]
MVTVMERRFGRRPLNQCHIAVEGAIGVGKTTLTRKLAEKLEASTFFEQVDDNPFIELFYQDPSRHALSVQLSFLFSRLKQWQTLHQQDLFTQGIVSDYIFAKDHLFATVTLSDEELALYEQVAKLVTVDLHKPDLVIYLQSDPRVIMDRIRGRNRPTERGIQFDYLKRVIAAYDQFFFHYQETPLLVVQTDRMNFADSEEAVDALIKRIGNMQSQTEFWASYA